MTSVPPITLQEHIAAIKPTLLKRAAEAAEDFMQASKNENFNLREYAKKGPYYLSSARLEGTTLGEKGASLKLLIHKYKNKSIIAIFKDGKVLGAKGYLAAKSAVTPILDKLCQKGKIKEEEVKFAKKQLVWD